MTGREEVSLVDSGAGVDSTTDKPQPHLHLWNSCPCFLLGFTGILCLHE